MKISNDDCDAKQIEAFLNGELRDEDEALFAEHLNDCPECCARVEQHAVWQESATHLKRCLLYTSPSPRDRQKSRMPSSA